jgi:hypothetical protein
VPDQVATEVKSLTHKALGLGAKNLRFTRSGARAAARSGVVVRFALPRTTPLIPNSRMRRATRSRPTSCPSPRSCFQHLRAPYTL